jgi:hypothetical protein
MAAVMDTWRPEVRGLVNRVAALEFAHQLRVDRGPICHRTRL